MKVFNPKTINYLIVSLVFFVLSLVTIYLVKTLDIFGSPISFSTAILLEVIFLLSFAYTFILALHTPIKILWSIAISAWKGILKNKYVEEVGTSKSPFWLWIMRRFDPSHAFGLELTITLVIALFFFIGFAEILQDVLFKEVLVRVDIRVVNLIPTIRTSVQTNLFSFFTFLANWQSIYLLVLVMLVLLWINQQKTTAKIFVASFFIEETSIGILKFVIGRIRPEQALSLIQEDSFSFPSGHALRATVIFGLLFYFIFRSVKSHTVKLLTVISYLILVFLISLSRIYLGVHYPSDVLASILFGLSLLTLTIGAVEINGKFAVIGKVKEVISNRSFLILPPLILLFSLFLNPLFIKIRPVLGKQNLVTISQINENTIKTLPLYSETLTGGRMEPISFIYIGTKAQIEELFLKNGWNIADSSTLSNTLRALAVGFQGDQYLNAPVTPSYLDAKPQDIAFQKSTQENTLQKRHHTRVWKTNFLLSGGRQIWVATASFDEGVGLSKKTYLPTHHIDPNIDAEREYIINSLGITKSRYIQVVSPQLGANQTGDPFFTDGKAVLVYLP